MLTCARNLELHTWQSNERHAAERESSHREVVGASGAERSIFRHAVFCESSFSRTEIFNGVCSALPQMMVQLSVIKVMSSAVLDRTVEML